MVTMGAKLDRLIAVLRKWGVLLSIFLAASFPPASFASECWDEHRKNEVYGEYQITEYKRYSGSLIPESAVVELASKDRLLINRGYFKSRKVELDDPDYDFRCDPAFVEGNVPTPSERRSNFYGFGEERKQILSVDVYAKDTVRPKHRLEVVDGELWELYGGWLLKREKITSSR